ncbi:MAG TPA: hypothetical protein VM033_00990 [Gemmatimonadaceae bacterium]|nr:hypothetical protein [Gemmatimonadaceae bacterium]
MTKYIRQLRAPLALCAALAVAACTVKDNKSDSSLARDTALNRDLALAGQDTSRQPQLRDVPATPAVTTPAPAPAPAPAARTPARTPAPVARPSTSGRTTTTPARTAPAPRTTASGNTVTRNTAGTAGTSAGGAVGTIASGTSLALRSNARVCTNTYQPGQTFSATTTSAVTGSNGATIPAGATVQLAVTQLKRSENVNDKIVMEFAVKSVSFGGRTYPVSGSVADAQVERVRNQPRDKDVQKVVGGAVLGAIAGQIMGKNTKSTVVGAAAGAAAGAGVAAGTANFEGCLPDGGNVTVTLNAPLQVKIT